MKKLTGAAIGQRKKIAMGQKPKVAGSAKGVMPMMSGGGKMKKNCYKGGGKVKGGKKKK